MSPESVTMPLVPKRPARPHRSNGARTAGGLSAMAVFLWSLPHFAIPGGGMVYRPPVASLVLLAWVLIALLKRASCTCECRTRAGCAAG